MRDDRSHFRSKAGNNMYAGSGMNQYCWGHKGHRPSGGKLLGKLRLWHCAECVARIAQEKAAKAATINHQPKEN